MAKSKALVISGPMDAKHVGGVNVMGGMQPSILDSYFNHAAIGPDDPPSHTFVAAGKIEIPKRSVTVADTIRRPSLSIRRSFSKLRRRSVSHISDSRSTSPLRNQTDMAVDKSDNEDTKSNVRPLRAQSSMSRLRQRVGLDRDLHTSAAVLKPVTPEPKAIAQPIRKHQPQLSSTKSFSRVISHSPPGSRERKSSGSGERELSRSAEPQLPRASEVATQRPSLPKQQALTIQRWPSPMTRRPSLMSTATIPSKQPLIRPKRADSGTAIDFDRVPAQERPSPFQDIMAVQSLAERMELYKKTREYWAYADHGLVEWTGLASGPKMVAGRV